MKRNRLIQVFLIIAIVSISISVGAADLKVMAPFKAVVNQLKQEKINSNNLKQAKEIVAKAMELKPLINDYTMKENLKSKNFKAEKLLGDKVYELYKKYVKGNKAGFQNFLKHLELLKDYSQGIAAVTPKAPCSEGSVEDLTYEFEDGRLTIYGTDNKDDFSLNDIAINPLFLKSVEYIDVYLYGCSDRFVVNEGLLDLSNVFVYVKAGGGDDYVYGGDEEALTVYGEEGDDQLYGGKHQNVLVGDEGDDLIVGGPSADYLFGLDGDDIIWGLGGNDIAYLGDGADIYYSHYDYSTGTDSEDTVYLGAFSWGYPDEEPEDGDVDRVYYSCENDTITQAVEKHDILTQEASGC